MDLPVHLFPGARSPRFFYSFPRVPTSAGVSVLIGTLPRSVDKVLRLCSIGFTDGISASALSSFTLTGTGYVNVPIPVRVAGGGSNVTEIALYAFILPQTICELYVLNGGSTTIGPRVCGWYL